MGSDIRYYIPGLLLFYFNLDVVIWSAVNLSLAPILYAIQVVALLYFANKKKSTILDNKLLLFLSVITLVVGLVHGFTSPTYFYKVFLYLLIFFMIRSSSSDDIQKSFYRVTFFFAALSLVFYVSVGILGMQYLLPLSIEGGAGASYNTNFLYSQLSGWAIRNCGIFREPGVFQIYLNIALLFYYNQNKNALITKISAVLIIAIITTLSSAGITVMMAIVLMQYLLLRHSSVKSTIIFVSFAIIAGYMIMSSFDEIFYKLQLGVEGSGSAFARYYSLIIPMKMWWDYPIFGCGASQFNNLILHYRISTGETLNPYLVTNCFTVNFATSGLLVGLFYLGGVISGTMKLCNKTLFPWAAAVLVLVMFSCEGIMYSGIFNLLLVGGLCLNKKSIV